MLLFLILTKTALNELSEIDLNLYDVPEILEKGFEIRKSKKEKSFKSEIKESWKK